MRDGSLEMLASFLSADAKMIGIDLETIWIENAKKRISNIPVLCQTDYLIGFAEKIPFPDNYFDMVTCQTVLMHVKDVWGRGGLLVRLFVLYFSLL